MARDIAEKSRPARGAWVEIKAARASQQRRRSRPARGAWVEMLTFQCDEIPTAVAPRKGRVG